MNGPDELCKQTSIIVCTVDRMADLGRCLESLQSFRAAGAEIMVVNNGPHRAAVDEISRCHGARVTLEVQPGLGKARNAGIRASRGAVLAFIDDDAQADDHWIPNLLAPFADPQVLAVVGSIWPQTVLDPVSETFDRLFRILRPESQLLLDAPRGQHPFPIRLAMRGNGSNMAIRRQAFEHLGYFDGRFGRGTRIGSGEETELFLRFLRAGGKIVFEPAAGIYHRHSSERRALRQWAFYSGCSHTAILTKYYLQEPLLRGSIVRYAAARILDRKHSEAHPTAQPGIPRLPFLLGSLYGPLAFLISAKK